MLREFTDIVHSGLLDYDPHGSVTASTQGRCDELGPFVPTQFNTWHFELE